jgi:hypothetical protein
MDHPRTETGRLRYKSRLRKDVDRLADGSLRDAELRRPFSFDDSHAGLQRSGHDLVAQAICEGLLYQAISRVWGFPGHFQALKMLEVIVFQQ